MEAVVWGELLGANWAIQSGKDRLGSKLRQVVRFEELLVCLGWVNKTTQ